MRFFIVNVGGSVLEEFEAASVLEATASPEWLNAPVGALLVQLGTGRSVAKRSVGAVEILSRVA